MLGLRECLELNNMSVTSALTPHMSTIDSFTLKRSLKLFRWGTIVAVYWGIQGTRPNENVSKLETDRQTKTTKAVEKKKDRQEATKKKKRSKRAIKNNNREALVSETMTFLPIERMPELLQYPCLWQNSGRIRLIALPGGKKGKG